MKTKTETAPRMGIGHALASHLRFAPRVMFDKPDDQGNGETEAEKAAREAAEKEAAEKAAREAAEKEAADKKAAEEAALKEAEKKKGSSLSDTEAKLLKEVMATKALKEAADKAAADAAAKLKDYEGIDPAEFKKLKEAAAAAEKAKKDAEVEAAEKAGDFDRVKKMMAEEHKRELEAERNKVVTAQSALDAALKTIDDLTVGTAFSNSDFINQQTVLTSDIARATFGSHFEVDKGQIVAYDKPKGAEGRTKLVNSAGNPIGFEDAVKRIVEARPDKEKLIRSQLKTGTKSDTNTEVRPEIKTDARPGLSRISGAIKTGALALKPE